MDEGQLEYFALVPNEDFTALRTEVDFDWYKKLLDARAKYNHRHIGEPKSYPCQVYSIWEDDPTGPYTYEHKFLYQQEVVCPECGSKRFIWPKVDSETFS